MYVCVCMCVSVCLYVCEYVCLCVCVMCWYKFGRVEGWVDVYAYVHVSVHERVCVCISNAEESGVKWSVAEQQSMKMRQESQPGLICKSSQESSLSRAQGMSHSQT